MLSNSLLDFHSPCPATAVGWTESDAKKAANPSPQLSDTSDIKIKNSHTGQGGDGGRKLCVEKMCFALSCRNSSQRVRVGRRNVHVCVHHVGQRECISFSQEHAVICQHCTPVHKQHQTVFASQCLQQYVFHVDFLI